MQIWHEAFLPRDIFENICFQIYSEKMYIFTLARCKSFSEAKIRNYAWKISVDLYFCIEKYASFYRQLCIECNSLQQHVGCRSNSNTSLFGWDCLHDEALSRGSELDSCLTGSGSPAIQHKLCAQRSGHPIPRNKGLRSPCKWEHADPVPHVTQGSADTDQGPSSSPLHPDGL